MLAIDIPGFGDLRLEHLVLDCNGTLAEDGKLLDGVAPALRELSAKLTIHVITAGTFGRAAEELAGLPLQLVVLRNGDQAKAKPIGGVQRSDGVRRGARLSPIICARLSRDAENSPNVSRLGPKS